MQASALAVASAPLDMEAPAPIPEAVTAAALQAEAPAAPVATWSGATLPPTESTPLVAPHMPPAPYKSPLRVGLRHVVERERQRRQDLAWRIWLAAFVAWLFITTSIYKYFALADFCPQPPGALTNFRNPAACKEPTWAAGLFYSVLMGFHVGYGLFTERNELWKLFTILHGLVMILFITSALAIFMARLSNKATEVPLSLCRERALMHATRLRFARCALTPSPSISCLQVAKELSTKALDSDESSFKQALRFLYDVVAPFLVVFFILLLGTLFEILYNQWNWVDALYFAFFSISTCGQTPPGSVDDAELLFVSVYLLTGIPLFGNAIGRLSNFITVKFFRIEEKG
jgi:hypothetical protein